MNPPRSAVAAHFEAARPGSRLEPLAGDASTRRFYRLVPVDGASVVIMDYGKEFTGETDDIRLERIFRSAGLPVACVLESLPRPGCLVMEDLGDQTLEQALQDVRDDGAARDDLYGRAVETAVAIAVRGTPVLEQSDRADGPALDVDRFRFEMEFFLEHFVAGVIDVSPAAGLRRELEALAAEAADTPRRVLCHRDYHSRNIMVRRGTDLAMVDIQDARWGPDSYDLASLLRDAYVDLDDDNVDRLLEMYRGALPWKPEAKAFRARFEIVALQRMVKALGTFGYQATALGRRHYLESAPRTVRRIRDTCRRLGRFREIARTLV